MNLFCYQIKLRHGNSYIQNYLFVLTSLTFTHIFCNLPVNKQVKYCLTQDMWKRRKGFVILERSGAAILILPCRKKTLSMYTLEWKVYTYRFTFSPEP